MTDTICVSVSLALATVDSDSFSLDGDLRFSNKPPATFCRTALDTFACDVEVGVDVAASVVVDSCVVVDDGVSVAVVVGDGVSVADSVDIDVVRSATAPLSIPATSPGVAVNAETMTSNTGRNANILNLEPINVFLND